MKNILFQGVCTALVTPFLNGSINYPLLERLIRRQPSEIAFRAAQGAMVGKFFGMVIKFGIGMAMRWLTASNIWPELPASSITTL